MKIFAVVAFSVTLLLTACGEKNDSTKSTTAVSITLPEGTPILPGGFRNEDEMKCGTNSRTYGHEDVDSAQLCKSRLGQEKCEQYFTKAACSALPEKEDS